MSGSEAARGMETGLEAGVEQLKFDEASLELCIEEVYEGGSRTELRSTRDQERIKECLGKFNLHEAEKALVLEGVLSLPASVSSYPSGQAFVAFQTFIEELQTEGTQLIWGDLPDPFCEVGRAVLF